MVFHCFLLQSSAVRDLPVMFLFTVLVTNAECCINQLKKGALMSSYPLTTVLPN